LPLSPDSALADSDPIARRYFFPEKRISDGDLWPSSFTKVTTEFLSGDWIIRAGTSSILAAQDIEFDVRSGAVVPRQNVTLHLNQLLVWNS
jgi:hypothetical protein